MTIDVQSCARCGKDHDELAFKKLIRPAAEWTHWAECPTTYEPILLCVTQEKT
jgi:hypothetical protein